jgi:hypothetical protein
MYEIPLQSGGKIVVPDHLVAQGEKTVHQVAADKSGRTGYKCMQVGLSKFRAAFEGRRPLSQYNLSPPATLRASAR